MPVRTGYQHGTPSWIDLSTTDPDAARAFYGAVFGWSFEVNPTDQGGEYIMARKGEHAAADPENDITHLRYRLLKVLLTL